MLIDQQGAVLTLTFDRPDRLNAVTLDDLNEMAAAVEGCSRRQDVDLLVIAGQGRAFCSGADLSADVAVDTQSAQVLDAANRLVTAIVRSPKLVVARARGIVAGAGVSIALAADLAAADEDSYFLLAFSRIGLMPDGGATALVTAAVGRARALRMALLAEKMPAADAFRVGLISHVWPTADYDEAFSELVAAVGRGPLAAMARSKDAINSCAIPQLDGALAREKDGQMALLVAPDFTEGVHAFSHKRTARFTDRPVLYR